MAQGTIWELMEVQVGIGKKHKIQNGKWKIIRGAYMKNKTKKSFYIFHFTFLILYLLLFSCTQPNPKNPFDPEVDPSSWAPSNLSYTFIDINSIRLTWTDNSNSEEGFRIEIKINSNNWTQLAELSANITEYTHNNVVIPAIIEYRICTYWGENISYAPESVTIDTSFPAPSNLSYTIIDLNSIELTWNDNSNGEDGFKIDKKVGANNWQIEYATVAENVTTWTDNNAEVEEELYYRLYAYCSNNNSSFLEINLVITFPPPSNLSYTIIDFNSIELTWNDNSNGEEGFKIDKKVGVNTWQIEFAVVGENIEEWTDNNAELEEELYYRLYAYCGNNNSNNIEINIVFTFIKTFGGSNFDLANSVQQTMDGDYIIAGETMSYGVGGYDFWLIKTDVVGNEQWDQTYGGGNDDRAHSVQQTTDGGYIIAGVGDFNFWLVKTDANGNEQWNQTYGGSSWDQAHSVQQTMDGGYIIAGRTLSYGAGYWDFWLVKTDSYGNEQWNQTYGGGGDERAYSVQQTMDGGFIIAGEDDYNFWLVKTDAYGNEQWDQTYGGSNDERAYSVQQTTDGGYIIAGYTLSYGAGGWDFWLVKTDSYGNEQWNQTYGGGGEDVANSVQQTTDGGFIIAGYTSSYGVGGYDFLLVKTNAFGNEQWNQTYGGNITDVANSVQQTTDGGYIIAGYTSSYGAGYYDFWLVKTDAYGNVNVGSRVNSKSCLSIERKEKANVKKLEKNIK